MVAALHVTGVSDIYELSSPLVLRSRSLGLYTVNAPHIIAEDVPAILLTGNLAG